MAEAAHATTERAAERKKAQSPVFKRIAAIAAERGLDFDIKKVFFGSEEKWAPLNKLSDAGLADFVEARVALSRINTNDPAWRPARDGIESKFGFYL